MDCGGTDVLKTILATNVVVVWKYFPDIAVTAINILRSCYFDDDSKTDFDDMIAHSILLWS